VRTVLSVAAGLVLAVCVTLALTAFAVPEPSTLDKPLQVTKVPAKP
jgi:hypothetical protein